MRLAPFAALGAVLLAIPASAADKTHYRTEAVGDVTVFYREAGPADAPTVLLLHGWGASSYMFRDIIPTLAERYHVVAPDLPGFGLTEAPERGAFSYTFESLTDVVEAFVEQKGLDRFAMYVFDYGAPVGFRLALREPERVAAIISQNGNAYAEGLSPAWSPIRRYWEDPSQENRDALRSFMTYETNLFQYTEGVPDRTLVEPEAILLAQMGFEKPGNVEVQLDLFGDYRSNVALYPEFQRYLRENAVPVLAVWGRNDPFFLPAGAEGYRRDSPDAVVRLYDTGHFALETHATEIADEIVTFLDRRLD